MTIGELNLFINVAEFSLLIFVSLRVLAFLKFSKEHLMITKRYVDLLDGERGRLSRTLEEKAGEIKQEIRISAAEAKADTKAEIRQSAEDTKMQQDHKNGS